MAVLQSTYPDSIGDPRPKKPMSICLCIDGGLDNDEEKLKELKKRLLAAVKKMCLECKVTGGIAYTEDLRNVLLRLGIGLNPLNPPSATA